MKVSIYSVLIISLFGLLISCGSTQKLSKERMEARIAVLEDENASLKKEMEAMKAQVRVLMSNLPKPERDTRSGGARPERSNGSRN